MSHPIGPSINPAMPLKRSFSIGFTRSAGKAQRVCFFIPSFKCGITYKAAAALGVFSWLFCGGTGVTTSGFEVISEALAEPAAEPTRLTVSQPQVQKKGLAVPLGVSVKNSVDGGLVVLGGLIKGTKLSAGHAVGDKNWYLFATDLNNVMIEPPQDFTGTMDISVELLLADTAVADRHIIRYQWDEPRTAEAEQTTQKKEMTLKLPPEEIEVLLKRGESLIASGDVTAARLVLTRPAEAGDPRAAYALASTYDRIVLEKLHAYGLSPDPAMAQHWYEKARQFGSTGRTALGRSTSKQN